MTDAAPGFDWRPPAGPRRRQALALRHRLFSGVGWLRGRPWALRFAIANVETSGRKCEMREHSYHELHYCGPGRPVWRVSFGTADRPAAYRGGPFWASAIGGGTFFFVRPTPVIERDVIDRPKALRAARSSVDRAPACQAKGPGFEPCCWRSIFNCWRRSDRSEQQNTKNAHCRDRTRDLSLGSQEAFQLSERPERLLLSLHALTAGDRWASLDSRRSRRTLN